MAEHTLITAYLGRLAERLPADAIDELADGLQETYQNNVRRGLPPDDAATAALAEFGRPDQITAAFASHSLGRRAAVRLLASGPVFAAIWGASLITAQAWTWPVPVAAVLCFGVALIATSATLAAVVSSSNPASHKLAAPAGIALIGLDATMLATLALAATTLSWPMTLAIPASVVRLVLTARVLPQLTTS